MRILLASLAIMLVFAASASPSCLTKKEARAKWPGAHLYWHTERHCWDNHRGGKRYRDPVFGSSKIAAAGDPIVTGPVYRALLMAPGFEPAPRFLPWEKRVAGSF